MFIIITIIIITIIIINIIIIIIIIYYRQVWPDAAPERRALVVGLGYNHNNNDYY